MQKNNCNNVKTSFIICKRQKLVENIPNQYILMYFQLNNTCHPTNCSNVKTILFENY